ncbi:MAG: hypothetical protein K5990_06730 [Oscillospiraceae bacterium]|nr:hypothetical protein [Oscillospiraceae bacterium]
MKRGKSGYVLALVLAVTLALVSSVSLLALRLGATLRTAGGQFAQAQSRYAVQAVAERVYQQLRAQIGRTLPADTALSTWLEDFAAALAGEVEPPLSLAFRCESEGPEAAELTLTVELHDPARPSAALRALIRVETEPAEAEAGEPPQEVGAVLAQAETEPTEGESPTDEEEGEPPQEVGSVLVRVSWLSVRPA